MRASVIRAERRLVASFAAGLCALILATAPAAAATGWTGPLRVGAADACTNVEAAIDPTGRTHVAAECSGGIRYSTTAAGGGWTTVYFAHPAGRVDLAPQIAVDGTTVYVAYTRRGHEGCGGGADAGVFVRHRSLPNGTWSIATRIGSIHDVLQSFRVVGGTFHATVMDNTGAGLSYETLSAGVAHRYPISDGYGPSSLRIGSDRRARIVYQGNSGLRYAVFTGSGFAKSSIPGTIRDDQNPALVLDATNHAYVSWSRMPSPGCTQRDPNPDDGTYVATNASGAWTAAAARRVTGFLGATSLTLEGATGRIHLLVSGNAGVRYFTRTATSPWTSWTLTTAAATDGAIRQNQGTGQLHVIYTRQLSSGAAGSIYEFTKP